MYADDLGRGVLSSYGQKIISIPNIDRRVSEGIRFANMYGVHFCAPARASVLKGYDDCRINRWKLMLLLQHDGIESGGRLFRDIFMDKVTSFI